MKYLLDTQLILWAAGEPDRLSGKALTILEDESGVLAFSAASLWEVAIKASLGRSDFLVEPLTLWRGLTDNGYEEIPIRSTHTLAVQNLPAVHKDPFDRMLIAQAMVEQIAFVTADTMLIRYPGSIILV